ncbi:helix-turn-helix domain-containing protein [Streptomyces lonarensis]|uniref:Helix-turn-helix domain-containing protein n=1 Tax=Streptomyces lonarensis TaxID=700599 RepID=A0A7X6D0Z8_9ACTN|nr:helix-turn-helix domain-containing protein [Streptomyces lonarensis]NJQ06227.1 helix-turn-helix domain-containing protein [Streptomyces lonarensis]
MSRAFSAECELGAHPYLTGRRVEPVRRLLLDGAGPGAAATAVGFFDQSHLHRHVKRRPGVGPGRYARSGATAVTR